MLDIEDTRDVFGEVREIVRERIRNFDKVKFAELFDKYKEKPVDLLIKQYLRGVLVVGLSEAHDNAQMHRFAKEILQPLHRGPFGLDYICLELESFLQPEIDQYSATGEARYLQRVVEREKELVQWGYPTQGRIDGGYFEILTEARRLGLPIIAMDMQRVKDDSPMEQIEEYNSERRDEYMVERIPEEGRGIFYVGTLHLPTMGRELRKIRRHSKVHLMNQLVEESLAGNAEKLFSECLSGKRYNSPVAVNFRAHEDLFQLLKDCLLEGHFISFDSVVYHPSPLTIPI